MGEFLAELFGALLQVLMHAVSAIGMGGRQPRHEPPQTQAGPVPETVVPDPD